MNILGTLFGGGGFGPKDTELPDIFPFGCFEKDFVLADVVNVYMRILTDVFERTQGLSDDELPLLWDNCVASDSSEGLITLMAKAMYEKSELCLVFDKATKVLRKADSKEQVEIKADYKAKGDSKVGVLLTFTKYHRTDMVKIYSSLEYSTVAALAKSMNLSKAVQFKMSEMRASVALVDSDKAITQAKQIAEGLRKGKDVMLDAKDEIVTATPDLTATQSAMNFIDQKRSLYLGLPASYITGVAAKGLGDSGVGEAKAIERGLKNYFFSIVKPVCKAIWGKDVTFESEDFDALTSALEALKTFELTDGELISVDNKRRLINKLFGLPEDTKGDPPAKIEAPAVPPAVPGATKPAPAPVVV